MDTEDLERFRRAVRGALTPLVEGFRNHVQEKAFGHALTELEELLESSERILDEELEMLDRLLYEELSKAIDLQENGIH